MLPTPGTTGLPKGVLSTQRQFLTNVYNARHSSRLPRGTVPSSQGFFRSSLPPFVRHSVQGKYYPPASLIGPNLNRQPSSLSRSSMSPDAQALRYVIPVDHTEASNPSYPLLIPDQMLATARGMKIVLMRKWDVEQGAPFCDHSRDDVPMLRSRITVLLFTGAR